MTKKIIKLSIAQIIMWAVACLADMVSYAGNVFVQCLCLFVVPVCLLVKYATMWFSIHSIDKKERLLKWIIRYIIFLSVWWLETYFIMMTISKLIETDKWITRNTSLLQNLIYGWWGLLALSVVTVAVLMHILSTLIRRFCKYKIIHKVINVLFVIGLIVFALLGEVAVYDEGLKYFESAIIAAVACFFFNWCYYKVQ